ncbi:MAG TPA: hypothetical protein DEG17_04005 [Cyanobacteria bacterium UBA11149]|nr:hypothetical protein [Cyanobacteria bacterium UBA11367]HBE57619.1 hypothetical protein [Cyanobacteria bacterium UBA11366]HBK63336.1 hypothetical protein [Cyanobacteria bacterium UBA11166]HBR73162.1 hypothetical protein [Cyanobacteria bacterium UBA11159]HBS69564.1 hypothetical protein [Cyanobacteria bacterium UBA11153]HBW88056.1 hypothetical protein [Cyanobacteria bacterium UBA11149]HCA96693.1 hypothetical protein [Cyanobacteria bacterium UBA9226]
MTSKSQQQSNVCGCFLLVSLGVLATLAAITLPFDSSKKAKESKAESKAKTYVGTMIRAQYNYLLERGTFLNDLEEMNLIVKYSDTSDIEGAIKTHSYSISATKNAVFHYGIARSDVYQTKYILFIPWRVKLKLKSYVSGVFIVPATQFDANASEYEMTTSGILCETNSPSTNKPAEPTYKDGILAYGEGTRSP